MSAQTQTHLTVAKTAQRLSLCRETVRRLFDAGILKGITAGGAKRKHRRIAIASIEAYEDCESGQ